MKRIITFVTIIVVILGGYLGFIKHQQNRRPVVGVLTMMHHPALDQIYRGFKDGLAEAGYHNGKNIQIEYQNANGDQSNLHTMATKLVNDHAKVVAGITTPACQSLANATKDTPVVMAGIGDPQGAGLVKNLRHPEGNVTGVHDVNPIREQLQLIKQFLPHLKTLGVIYTSSDPSAENQYHQIVKYARAMHIDLKTYTIANANQLNQVSQEMVSQTDAVIVPCDNLIAGSMATLVKNADAAKKPVFPGADTMVKDGGVATVSLSQYGQGVAAGKVTAKLLKGAKPSDLPVVNYHHGVPILNLKQAHKLGLRIPPAFQKQAQNQGEVFK